MSVESEPPNNTTIVPRKWPRRLAVAMAFAVAVAWPVPYRASPKWEVLVENAAGQPAPDMKVRLSYQNYSVENDSHEIICQTDANGRAQFAEQIGRANVTELIFYSLMEAALLAHGSFGRHAYVYAYGHDLEGDDLNGDKLVDWNGKPDAMRSVIVVKPAPSR